MSDSEHTVDLRCPISFTSDPSAQQKPYIANYINENPKIFKARALQAILSDPPTLVLQLKTRIEQLTNDAGSELNNHILRGSPALHWAAEVYQHIPQHTRNWLSTGDTPDDLDTIEDDQLSPNYGVYFCQVGSKFYCGSGTSSATDSTNAGTRARQLDRSITHNESDSLSKAIKAADRNGDQVSWAQGMEVAGTFDLARYSRKRDTTVEELGELLHFRILCKLGEQLLSTGTCAHAKFLYAHNKSFWPTPPSWTGLCLQTAWSEGIRGVATDEIRLARRRVANLTPEKIEENRRKSRKSGMTDDQIDKRRRAQRKENLSDEQVERIRFRTRTANLSEEQKEKRRISHRRHVEGLTAEQKEVTRSKARVANMSEEDAEKSRVRHRKSGMSAEVYQRRLSRNLAANMTPEKRESKLFKLRVGNMTEEAVEKKRLSQRNESLSDERLEKKRRRRRVGNMSPEKLEKARASRRMSAKKLRDKKKKALREQSESEKNSSTA